MIEKKKLFIIAGLVWCLAGSMVINTGIKSWLLFNSLLIDVLAVVIYIIFYLQVFSKLVKKHEERIISNINDKMKVWQFFDKKSYIIMVIMMSFGIILRKSNILPISFFSFFYIGLGLALFSCGVRFIYLYYKHKNN